MTAVPHPAEPPPACRCCTTAAATARLSSTCTASAAPLSGTRRQAGAGSEHPFARWFYLLFHPLTFPRSHCLQVAFGLLQFLTSVGSGSKGGVNAPVGLNALLQQYDLPPNPLKKVMHARMDREPHLFTRRPLEAQVLNYAGGLRT